MSRSGVPGELRGLQRLHESYGRIPWEKLIRPAVTVARYGFEVSVDQEAAMDSLGSPSFLSTDPNWATDFAPNGTRVSQGETMTRKSYGDLLELIAERGINAFYSGDVARSTINAVQAAGGIMTLHDLSNYSVAIRSPIEIAYHDFKITSGSAPSGGTVALIASQLHCSKQKAFVLHHSHDC